MSAAAMTKPCRQLLMQALYQSPINVDQISFTPVAARQLCSASPTPYTTLGNTLMVNVEAVASIPAKMIMCSCTTEGTLAS